MSRNHINHTNRGGFSSLSRLASDGPLSPTEQAPTDQETSDLAQLPTGEESGESGSHPTPPGPEMGEPAPLGTLLGASDPAPLPYTPPGPETGPLGFPTGAAEPNLPPPPNRIPALSPAQRAAQTRAANRANGATGQTKAATAGTASTGSDRAGGLSLELWVSMTPERIILSFRPVTITGAAMRSGLGSGEGALPDLAWSAYPHHVESGELGGFHLVTLSALRAGTVQIEQALPLMRRCDRLLTMAREESEDLSFGFVASTLAAHFRVSCVKVKALDGTVTEHRRGAAYVTAHRAGEALLASVPAPDLEPAPAMAQAAE